ncbi:FG-GAP-like repeat-containing protein [Oerskovia enterophila]|uniref:FG-GAP-like repeat-containing protein n=1 Tax=Oerskovia enterophila TaxID=43678 RepID=UPI00382DC18C
MTRRWWKRKTATSLLFVMLVGTASITNSGAAAGHTMVDAGQEGGSITPTIDEVALEVDPVLRGELGAAVARGDDPLSPTSQAAPSARGAFGAPEVVLSATADGSGFATVGVTWATGSAPDGTEVGVRTRTGDVWSEWIPVELDVRTVADDDPPDGGALRDGTDPLLVGEVNEIQAAVRGTAGQAPVDARLVVVDPGATEPLVPGAAAGEVRQTRMETTPSRTETDAGTGAAQILAAAASAPRVHSRAEWGADESLMRWTPEIGSIKAAVVHHTAGTNDYTAAQVPSILRGIYSYHSISRGWGDIGYNFLIDKFGTVWEGRAGGIDRAVIGAHASGVNSQTFGVSVMGNYEQAAPSQAALNSLTSLIAWKLGLHGVSPVATTTVSGISRPTVLGHRDVGQTACPGVNIYSRLAGIRSAAASLQGQGVDRGPVRDLTADGFPDLMTRSTDSLALLTSSASGWAPSKAVGQGWPGPQTIAPGDWNGDGHPDLMLLERASGRLWLYRGTAAGSWDPRVQIGGGWGVMNLVVGGQDWTGDGRPDLLARKSVDGSLWVYPSDGRGGFGVPRQIGSGWNQMTTVSMLGNLSDGRPALVARRADGVLLLYRGDGRGGFGTTSVVGPGWNGMSSIIGAGDVTGDRAVDLVARSSSGDLWLYPGDGQGRFGGRSLLGTGWQVFTTVLPAGRPGAGEDFFAVTPGGVLYRYAFRGTGGFDASRPLGVPAASVAELISSGDWNGDGRADIMTRRTNGDLYVHQRRSDGGFEASGTRVGTGWQIMTQVVGAGDWLGTGTPGLLALERGTGRIWLYPGNGRGGFGNRLLIASGAANVDRIVSAGHWSGGRSPDLITRDASSGVLSLRKGNGGALLDSPRTIGTGWSGMSAIVGMGDVNADGAPDLIAQRADGTLLLYAGDGRGGFLSTRTVGTVARAATVS